MNKIILTITTIFICTIAYAENITINWGVDNQPYTTTTCEIGGDVILPSVSKRGHVFRGWTAEHFDRGTFDNWSVVPLSAILYSTDYYGNQIPSKGDYIIITDTSDSRGDYDNLISITVQNLGGDAAYPMFSYTFIENGSTIKTVTYPSRSLAEVSAVIKEGMYITLNRGGWPTCRVNFYSDAEHTQPLQVKYNGNLVSAITSNPQTNGITEQIYYANLRHLQGVYKFVYDGVWETDGKNGWKPVEQISNE